MVSNNNPVGVFDSGIGGLSVLREIRQRLPDESLYYIADSAHIPYGEKSPEYIRKRCDAIAGFLLRRGAKALVIACNTATAAAAAELRQRYPHIPIIAMEPAVKPAAQATRNGKVGVLATSGTLKSARFAALLDKFATDITVITQPCPGLVEQIETGLLHHPQTAQLLEGFVQPLLEQGCDTLILGCTHYPFLKPLLLQQIPAEITLIDTGAAVARQLENLLTEKKLIASGPPETLFWSSSSPDKLEALLPPLWGTEARVKLLPV